jgi:hypothetical protein
MRQPPPKVGFTSRFAYFRWTFLCSKQKFVPAKAKTLLSHPKTCLNPSLPCTLTIPLLSKPFKSLCRACLWVGPDVAGRQLDQQRWGLPFGVSRLLRPRLPQRLPGLPPVEAALMALNLLQRLEAGGKELKQGMAAQPCQRAVAPNKKGARSTSNAAIVPESFQKL